MTATVTREPAARVDLALEGMTCAACANRIERKLNKLDGVEASVNYATEQAAVRFDPHVVAVADLLGAVEAAGYRAAPAAEARTAVDRADAIRRKLVVAAALSGPLVVLAMATPVQFGDWEWLAFALATPVVFWAGFDFHRAALVNARHGAATMDTLVSIGTLAAWGWSVAALLLVDGADVYFEVAAVITTLILLGRYLEARARRRSSAAIRGLLELGAKEAHVLRDGVEFSVPIAEVMAGDLFVVRPGEKVATDGVVVEGASAIDRSMLTGEPVPDDVGPGDAVAGATVNTYGRLIVRATSVGEETALAQIATLVAEAQSGKAPIQRLVDRVSGVFVPVVLVLSLATLVGWLVATGNAADAFSAAVAVLIIACPCALGLATPTALHGRHRARRAARNPHQGPGGSRAHAAHHDGRARQDGHRHRGADGSSPMSHRSTARRARRCCGSRAPWRPPPSIRSRGRWQTGPGARSASCPRSRTSGTCPGSEWSDPSRATPSRSGAATVPSRSRGTASLRATLSVVDTLKPTSAGAVADLRGARAHSGASHRRRACDSRACRGRGRDRARARRGVPGRQDRRDPPPAGRG